MALTPEQKRAIAWVDYAAGLASVETGPLSFAIGAAASMAYYYDKKASEGWGIVFYPPQPIPSTSNDLGILHNLTCEQLVANGFTQSNYDNIIQSASEVRPDLSTELNAITISYFNEKVNSVQLIDLITPESELEFTLNIIPLNVYDQNIFLQTLNILQNANETEWVNNLNDLILQISSFTLSETEKTGLINSLQILKHSFVLWGS
jgi:hypothetical protein